MTTSFNDISLKELFKDTFNYKLPTYDFFYKYSKSERLDRAWYFILNARIFGTLPMKIVSYCTALECCFTTGRTELTHQIAEKVAMLTEGNKEQKIKTFNLVKKAYGIRSTIVHGSFLKGSNEDLEDVSEELDNLLRMIVNEHSSLLKLKDNELDNYFLNKLLK